MTIFFRVILFAVSLITYIYVSGKLKKSQVEGHATIFWILFSAILIVVSIFPGLADWLAKLLGIYSTENMVFLIIIFTLLIREFFMTIKCSNLEYKIKLLAEELAIMKIKEPSHKDSNDTSEKEKSDISHDKETFV